MKFNPERCKIPDEPMKPFIDPEELHGILERAVAAPDKVREVVAKALGKNRLTLEETAILLKADSHELTEEIKQGARELKKRIYGNRIVLFAPLYIGNHCINNCRYCGFKASNKKAIRRKLTDEEIIREVEALEDNGQKRLILVFGEHPLYNAEYIAHTTRLIYSVKKGNGEIRRVNINAAPLDIEGFRTVKTAGIGTYQIFQETYHPETYRKYHPGGPKKDFDYRLTSLDRAQEAGLDDVGIGALFGLYDWRYEVLGLVRHTNHLEAVFNVGPHTISFPRIKDSSEQHVDPVYLVNDEIFVRLVAILRLAVPYTGMILTAREEPGVRREVMQYGVSQIDGGTKLEIGSYSGNLNEVQNLNREQFRVNDPRSLAEIIEELINMDYLPSFCTACYRLGRTGEHFMEFSVPGFIKRFCTPNALLTLAEYLEDYAKPDVAEKGWNIIRRNTDAMEDYHLKEALKNRLDRISKGERDLYF